MKMQWIKFGFAYILWAVFIALGLLILVVSRTSLTTFLRLNYSLNNFQRGKQVELIDQAYFLIMGLILVVLMIVVEEYFKNGARKNVLTRRLARVFGIEIFFFFLASVASVYLVGFSTLVTAELVFLFLLSCVLLMFGYKNPPRTIQNKI